MGRPRKSKEEPQATIGFRPEPELIKAIDEEAARMAAERRGMKVSRSQAMKILLWEALDARAKVRG